MDKIKARNMAAQLKGEKFGSWTVGDLIDCGKTALVLHAKSCEAGACDGVIKIFDPEVVERFGHAMQIERIKRELDLCGHGNPNLVDIYGGGECLVSDTVFHFVVMEFISGKPLSTMLDELSYEEILKITKDVASAAYFLETKEIVHRDIKPENIMIQGTVSKKAILMDLCVIKPFKAKSITDDEFKKQFISTLRYSPPELLSRYEDGSPEGWRAVTFYQLGGMLHDMIMKEPLYKDFSDPFTRLVNAVQTQKPIIKNDSMPNELICFTQNCLVKSPQTRLQIVEWDDFFTIGVKPDSVYELRKKIKIHQVVSQTEVNKTTQKETKAQAKFKRKLLGIADKIADSIRDDCLNDKIFPPIECRSEALKDCSTANILISFAKYESKAMYGNLSICFLVQSIDVAEDIISLAFTAKISNHKIDIEEFGESQFSTIYKGIFDIPGIKKKVLLVLYSVFNAAVEAFEVKRERIDGPKFIENISL